MSLKYLCVYAPGAPEVLPGCDKVGGCLSRSVLHHRPAQRRYSSWICPCVTGSTRRQKGSALSSLLGFIQAVRKRACDTRWEARDSTVEFLGHLGGAPSCRSFTEQVTEPSDVLLGGCSFTVPLLKEALQDPESYVRASSISALAQTLTPSWQEGAALTQEQVGRNNSRFYNPTQQSHWDIFNDLKLFVPSRRT